jgi:hypothetical protein
MATNFRTLTPRMNVRYVLNQAWTALRLSQRSSCSDFTNITPCSLVLSTRSMLGSCLAYSSTLQMDATCTSETSIRSYWTKWRHISDDIILLNTISSECHVHVNTDIQCSIGMWSVVSVYHTMRLNFWRFRRCLPCINIKKLNCVTWVRERTMPIERPPLVDEVSANVCG